MLKNQLERSSLEKNGFTLLELAIVLVIIGISAAFGNQAWLAHLNAKKLQTNQQQLEEIHQSMLAHLANFSHLPCPDTNGDGQENRKSNGACEKHHGRLPYLDLQTHAFDQFGQPFFYAINQNSTSVTAANHLLKACGQASLFGKFGEIHNEFWQCPIEQQNFCTQAQCSRACAEACISNSILRNHSPYFQRISPPLGTSTAAGSLIICNQNAESCNNSTANSKILAGQLPALVISFGKGGNQAWLDCTNATANEQINCNGSRYFQQFAPSEEYRHQMTWLTNHQAKQALASEIDW